MPPENKAAADRGLRLTRDLDENVRNIKHEFEGVETLEARYVENRTNPGLRCCLLYSDSMINKAIVNDSVIRPINLFETPVATSCMLDVLMTKVVQIDDIKKTADLQDIVDTISIGDTVLLAQGCAEALLLNTKGWPVRGLEEPDGEKVLHGPREGFNEALLMNLSMIRRRIKTKELKMKFTVFGARTRTKACICYMGGIANPEIVEELESRLKQFDLDGALDVNYLEEFIKDAKRSIFKTVGSTQRPDVVTAKLLEGRVALFLDGTPEVVTVPYLFTENFQTAEDYYVNFWYASFYRLLRVFAFLLSVCAPAFYVAAITNQQELLPTPLILSISVARQGVPFPTILEVFLMLIMFDVLREAGIRVSSNIGQALSIVGALVIGQAAVEAKIVSAPIIIVVAVAGITGLVVPKLTIAIVALRWAFLLLSAVLGLFGLVFGLMGLLIYLVDLRSFGMRVFLDPSTNYQAHKDTAFRAPWWKMRTRPPGLAKDVVRKGPEGKPEA